MQEREACRLLLKGGLQIVQISDLLNLYKMLVVGTGKPLRNGLVVRYR